MRFLYLLPFTLFLAFALTDDLTLPDDVQHALDDVSADSFMTHVRFLADDALLGRESGTVGYETAARYVEDQYRRMGVLPAGEDGSYRQEVTLRSAKVLPEASSVEASSAAGKTKLAYGKDFLILPSTRTAEQEVNAPVVFAGFGVSAPEYGYDDYADIDVNGKIALVLYGTPNVEFDHVVRATLAQTSTKLETAVNKGAIGVIAVTVLPWDRIKRFASRPISSAVLPDGTVLSHSGNPHEQLKAVAYVRWESLAAALPDTSLASVKSLYRIAADPEADRPDLGLTLHIRSASVLSKETSPNIIGMLRGIDPELNDTYMVHSAHLDHVGVGQPVQGDSIYNGAHDNASGVASVLEIARIYSKLDDGRPRRSLLFLMSTAEERGLLGSAYFAHHPTVPKEKIVANINTDMPTLIAPLRSIVPLGAKHSTLMKPVAAAAAYLDLEIADDHMPEQVRFVRSDHYSFVRQGIPALHVKYGLKSDDPERDLKAEIDHFTRTYYHKPADGIDAPFDLEAATTYVKLNFLIGYQVATSAESPVWNEGDYFKRFVR